MQRIRIGFLIIFLLYLFISGWIDIPDKLFSGLDILKSELPNEWSWMGCVVDTIKYLLDKIGWALILFIIQKQYEKRMLSCLPIRCTLLSSKPVKYDSQLHNLSSKRILKIGFGRYYYHLVLQLNANNNHYFDISIKGLGTKIIKLKSLGDSAKMVAVDLQVCCNLQKIIWMPPIGLTLCFYDENNIKYIERILVTSKKGEYSCNIKSFKKR